MRRRPWSIPRAASSSSPTIRSPASRLCRSPRATSTRSGSRSSRPRRRSSPGTACGSRSSPRTRRTSRRRCRSSRSSSAACCRSTTMQRIPRRSCCRRWRPATDVRTALCALLLALTVSRAAQGADDLARYVDPFIGTLGSGFVFPGPAAPYGMVQLSPDTNGYFAYTGYLWSDQAIRGFSHVHVESMGVPEGGNLPFMPTTGTVVTDAAQYQSLFHHASEVASPGYYRVRLDSYGIGAELTAGLRVGMHRYTFPPSKQANVLLDVGRQIAGGSDAAIPQRDPGFYSASIAIENGRTVSGVANPSLDHPQGYAVYFVARFDRPFCAYGVWRARGAAPEPGVASVAGTGAGAYVTFDTTADPVVLVAVGISFVSVANARENLVA